MLVALYIEEMRRRTIIYRLSHVYEYVHSTFLGSSQTYASSIAKLTDSFQKFKPDQQFVID